MDNIKRLEEFFSQFPGIGPRQAKRLVHYLLTRSNSTVSEFTKLILETKKSTIECNSCHRLFLHSSQNSICNICNDKNRDDSLLMIVARDSDFETIEKSGVYKGKYFVLGGTVPILDSEPQKRIRLEKLLEHISNENSIKEVIISLNTNREGEHTLDILRDALNRIKNNNIKISVLGRGLSTGAEIEYADSETIKYALKNRV